MNKPEFIGNYDTGLTCNCGGANIIDHARAHPERDSSLESVRTSRLGVMHAYWCNACGVVYHPDVIEGVRGYIPLDKKVSEER